MDHGGMELIIDECEKIELIAGDIYHLFSIGYPQDKKFWWRLFNEEKNHAALVKSSKHFLNVADKIPDGMFHDNLNVVKSTVNKLKELKANIEKELPPREKTFEIAYNIENMAGELHYQRFMSKVVSSEGIDELFQKLNADDKDHAKRIKNYMDASHQEKI